MSRDSVSFTKHQTTQDWFKHASQRASCDKDKVIGIFDLDATLLIADHERHSRPIFYRRFTDLHSVDTPSKTADASDHLQVYVDPVAMRQIELFANNQHIVMVATTATYLYDSVAKIFNHYGIALDQNNFFNRASMMEKLNATSENELIQMKPKPTLLEKVLRNLGKSAMLFDDQEINAPLDKTIYAFKKIMPGAAFPTIVKPPTTTKTITPGSETTLSLPQRKESNPFSLFQQTYPPSNPLQTLLTSRYKDNPRALERWLRFAEETNNADLCAMIANHFELLPLDEWLKIIEGGQEDFIQRWIFSLLTTCIQNTFTKKKETNTLLSLQSHLQENFKEPIFDLDQVIEELEQTLARKKDKKDSCSWLCLPKPKTSQSENENGKRINLAKILGKHLQPTSHRQYTASPA